MINIWGSICLNKDIVFGYFCIVIEIKGYFRLVEGLILLKFGILFGGVLLGVWVFKDDDVIIVGCIFVFFSKMFLFIDFDYDRFDFVLFVMIVFELNVFLFSLEKVIIMMVSGELYMFYYYI